MNPKHTSAISVTAFAATALSYWLYKRSTSAKRKCDVPEEHPSKRQKSDMDIVDGNSVNEESRTKEQSVHGRAVQRSRTNETDDYEEARSRAEEQLAKLSVSTFKTPSVAISNDARSVASARKVPQVARITTPYVKRPDSSVSDTGSITVSIASTKRSRNDVAHVHSPRINDDASIRSFESNRSHGRSQNRAVARPTVSINASIKPTAAAPSNLTPKMAPTVRPVVVGAMAKTPVIATVNMQVNSQLKPTSNPFATIQETSSVPNFNRQVNSQSKPTSNPFATIQQVQSAKNIPSADICSPLRDTTNHSNITSRNKKKQKHQGVIRVRDSLLPTQIRQKKQASAAKNTHGNVSRTTPQRANRIRVRDSLLPMDLRQRMQQQTQEDEEEEIIATTTPLFSTSSTTNVPQSGVRIRDSLLPMDIRQRIQQRSQDEENAVESLASNPFASSSDNYQQQSNPFSPPPTTKPPMSTLTPQHGRVPKKLTPTRFNVFERPSNTSTNHQ